MKTKIEQIASLNYQEQDGSCPYCGKELKNDFVGLICEECLVLLKTHSIFICHLCGKQEVLDNKEHVEEIEKIKKESSDAVFMCYCDNCFAEKKFTIKKRCFENGFVQC